MSSIVFQTAWCSGSRVVPVAESSTVSTQHKQTPCTINSNETMSQLFARMEHYLTQWIALSKIYETIESSKELVMKEKFLLKYPRELSIFTREHKPQGKGELLDLVKTFTEAHSSFGKREIPRDQIRSNPVPATHPTSKFEERKYQTSKFSLLVRFQPHAPVSFVAGPGTQHAIVR